MDFIGWGRAFLISFICIVSMTGSAPVARVEYQSGFASVEFDLPPGTPLGGYGTGDRRLKKINLKRKKNHTLFAPNQGTHDPVRSKAWVVRRGSQKLLFLSLDLVGVTSEITAALKKPLSEMGYKPENVFVSATHTHSGPGGLTKSLFFGLVAMDLFQKRAFEGVIRSIEESVRLAESRLEPCEIIYSKFDVNGISRSRRGRAIDPTARIFWVRQPNQGQWLGAAIHYAIHGIAFDDDRLTFSADIPGGIELGIEEELLDRNQAIAAVTQSELVRPTAQMWNGAEGDVSPKFFEKEGILKTKELFRKEASQWVGQGRVLSGPWFVKRFSQYSGTPGLTLRTCLKDWMGKQGKRQFKWIPKNLALSLDLFLSSSVELGWIDWSGIKWMTWPGEPTAALGETLRQTALKYDPMLDDAFVLGLTNGHFAYFVSPDEHEQGGYEACFSLWGKKGGSSIIEAYLKSF